MAGTALPLTSLLPPSRPSNRSVVLPYTINQTRAFCVSPLSSSSSSSGDAPTSSSLLSEKEKASSPAEAKTFQGCKACGRDDIEPGCNGEGRVQGGIGVVPGFQWWPIKAYRPCPAFVESGGRYRRSGQSLDEIAFGRKGSKDDLDVTERLKQ